MIQSYKIDYLKMDIKSLSKKSIVTLIFFEAKSFAKTRLVNPLPIKQIFINKFNFNNKY